MEGIPVELIDTAGLRAASDEAERMGVAKSHEAMADADVVLLVIDATVGVSEQDRAVLERESGSAVLVAWNKADLVASEGLATPPFAMKPQRIGHPGGVGAAGSELRTSCRGWRRNWRAACGDCSGGWRRWRGRVVRDGDADESGGNIQGRYWGGRLCRLDAAEGRAVAAAIPHEMVLLDLCEALRGLDAFRRKA